MRSPKVVLKNLIVKAKQTDYKFDRLYRNFYNTDFFLVAYSNIYAKEGNMTVGVDGKTIDGMSFSKIENIIGKMKDCSYQPKPVKRIYIPKKNGKKRPLGIPSFEDKLVQEVMRMILESIYENSFSSSSHGFRPNKSCHTALKSAKVLFTGTKWFIEGDIESFFDNIDHKILVGILRKRITDERFINLVEKFLKAGYMEKWEFHKTYSGTPQGGIISPILSNIYLNELDKYMDEYKKSFDKGRARQRNYDYKRLTDKLQRKRKNLQKNWTLLSEEDRNMLKSEICIIEKEVLSLNPTIAIDESYRRLQYVRYADDFVIGIIGSKEDAKNIKVDLTNYLKERLALNLSQEKTLITHSSKKIRFLGYDIKVKRSKDTVRMSDGSLQRTHNMHCELYVPTDMWIKKVFEEKIVKVNQKTGQWQPFNRCELIRNDDLEILQAYNAKIRGLYNFYRLALNVCNLADYKYFMEYSMYKTFANKYKSSVGKIKDKYCKNGIFQVSYNIAKGIKVATFYNEGFKRKMNIDIKYTDLIENVEKYSGRTSLIQRMNSQVCEWCGATNVPIHIHHVRKLKNLKGKKRWEQHMIARNRKTMAVCVKCHTLLHSGKLD